MSDRKTGSKAWGFYRLHFTEPRIRPYLENAQGDAEKAVRLIELNIDVSLRLWRIVLYLEVALKNALARQMEIFAHNNQYQESWVYDEKGNLGRYASNPAITTFGNIAKIMNRLPVMDNKNIPDKIISELGLEFCSKLVSKRHMAIWPTLANAFPNANNRNQKNIKIPIEDLRYIRNRIAHHEPIWHLNLEYYLNSFARLASFIDYELHDLIDPIIYDIKQVMLDAS